MAEIEEPGGRPSEDADARVPVQPASPIDRGFGAVAGELIAEGLDDLRAARCEHLERLEGDQRLRDELASQQFQGPLYERFEDELVRYALAVLNAWLITGTVFKHVRRVGIALAASDQAMKRLREDSDERHGLSGVVVAAALPDFRQRAMKDGRWSSAGQASISTYFMGACLLRFPNEFRRFEAELRGNPSACLPREDILLDEQPRHDQPVDAQVVGNVTLSADLAEHPTETQAVVVLTQFGYRQSEIAELLGMTEKAVEGRLYRWRMTEKKRRTTDGEIHDI